MPVFAIATAAGPDECAKFRAANPAFPATHGFVHDPASIDRDALIQAGVIVADNGYSTFQLARALCHVAIWRHCVATAEIAHVVDARAIVRSDFAATIAHAMGDDFDVIVWGMDLLEPAWIRYAPGVEGRLMPDQSHALPDATAFRAGRSTPLRFGLLHCPDPVGYTVSPAGARHLLQHCLPFGAAHLPYFRDRNTVFPNVAFDREMARQYATMRAFTLQPLLAIVVEQARPGIVTEHFLKAFCGLAGQPALRMSEGEARRP